MPIELPISTGADKLDASLGLIANVEVHVPFASSSAVTPGGGPHRRRNDEGLRDWAVPLLLWATVQLNNLAQHRHHLSIPIDSLTLQHSHR